MTQHPLPLTGITVVELGSAHSVAIAGRILSDLGAAVVAESAAADPQDLLAYGKAPVEEELADLLTDADVLLVDRETHDALCVSGSTPEVIQDHHPRLVYACISPFGLTGPWRDLPSGELFVQAAGAVLMSNGVEGEPPVPSGVPVAAYGGAILAAIGVLAAVYESQTSGAGQFLDQAEFDALVVFSSTLLPGFFLTGRPLRRLGNRHSMASPWNTYRTKDSWLVICTMNNAQFETLMSCIGRTDLIVDPRYATATGRVAYADELDREIAKWTCARTTSEAIAVLEPAGVVASAIQSVPEVLTDPQARWRGVVAEDGNGVASGPFLKFRSTPGPAAEEPDRPGRGGSGPLAGVRVVEAAAHTAGPLAGRLLALLGAEVVKVEPPGGEAARHLAQQIAGQGYLFHLNNTDKLGVTLDLRDRENRVQLWGLLAGADAFITNLAPSTLVGLELDSGRVTDELPRIVYCALSGFGLDGPYRARRAFDMMVQAESGIMSLTADDRGRPRKTAMSIADLFGACSAALGTVAALVGRRRGGTGCVVDCALFDIAVWLTQDSWRGPRSAGTIVAARDGYLVVDDRPSVAARVAEILAYEPAPSTMTTAELRQLFTENEIASFAPRAVHEVATAPHTAARHLLSDVTYDGQRVRVIGSPFKFSRNVSEVRRAAPAQGRDSATLLTG